MDLLITTIEKKECRGKRCKINKKKFIKGDGIILKRIIAIEILNNHIKNNEFKNL